MDGVPFRGPIRTNSPVCDLVETGLFNKVAIRIGSSVRLTKNVFNSKPTEDGPKKFIKLWPYSPNKQTNKQTKARPSWLKLNILE